MPAGQVTEVELIAVAGIVSGGDVTVWTVPDRNPPFLSSFASA